MPYFCRQIYIAAALKQITPMYLIFMPKFTLFLAQGVRCYDTVDSRHKIRLTTDLKRNGDTVDCMLRSVILSTFLLLWQFTTTIETLLVETFNTQSPWSRQNHVAACIHCYLCLSIFEFVPEALTFIYAYRSGNTPKHMAWAPTHLAYTPTHPAFNPTYMYISTHPACTHQHI